MYRIEIFDERLKFVDAALAVAQPIVLDWLTFGAFTITVATVQCKKGWYVHIAEGCKTLADCIVSDVQPGNGTMELSLRPLQALFDVEVFASPIPDVVSWLQEQITAQFVNNADSLQNRPVRLSAATRSVYPLMTSEDATTLNLLDVMALALTTHGIVCDCRLDFSVACIRVDVAHQGSAVTLEADLNNVLDKYVTLGDSYGAANKCVIREVLSDEATGEVTYPQTRIWYLHPDGSIDESDTERITPVFWVLRDVGSCDGWESQAFGAALEALTPQRYDNEIELVYRRDDRIARPMELEIGTVADIYMDGQAYRSLLTGRTIDAGKVTLTFGCVRTGLTQKMILERRV